MSVYTKYLLERFWLKLRSKNIRKVWIQSETLRDQFKKKFPHIPTGLTPFASQPIQNTNWDTPSCDFLYPASDAPHKNHLNLFKAWEILADGGLYPSLYVTIPKNGNLNREIERLQKNGVQIVNLSEITHDQTLYLLKKSRALIFPSFLESFGLPIIEANYFNIPILASELDYVRDFSSPVQTFDPHSSKSIARAVKRFLERKNDLIQHPITASEFLNQVQRDFI